MRNWNFVPDHAISLTLAADARLCSTDYTNDQIWQLCLGNSDPPAISLETTFGLRARLCRIFPRFSFKGQVINDPAHFSHPIKIQKYYPNYICLTFKPFSSINVKLEYWVPGSQVVAGRTRIVNTGHEACTIELEWAELLLPTGEGSRMAVNEIGMTNLLMGRTADLVPVLFLTGGAQAGKSPYPSLNLSYTLSPRAEAEAQWVHASLNNSNASYELAKKVISLNWNAEIAVLTQVNSRLLEIYTGNKDWDNAFYSSQNIAYQLFLGPTKDCRAASIVTTRKPDQGFSSRKDGSDYNHLWNGQTLIDVSHLAKLILPASPHLLQGLLDNFLDTQTPQGEIDWKPGLGGQRSRILATPLLAGLTLQLYEYTGDIKYLENVFPKLVAFFFSWFSTKHDRDGDQFPEWDQVVQTGFEDLPLFSQDHPWSLGVDISSVESPDLISYLYKECMALLVIAKLIPTEQDLSRLEDISRLQNLSHVLKSLLDQAWSDQQACYQYRDRDAHIASPMEMLGSIHGVGVIDVLKEFPQPVRPMIQVNTKREGTRPAQIFIHGTGSSGAHRVEHIPAQRIHWNLHTGFFTSDYTYGFIERIEINGISPDDAVIARTINFARLDLSLLIPLWSGIPSDEQANILINLTLMNKKKFLAPYGLRSCIDITSPQNLNEDFIGLHLPWIDLILDGLIDYGEIKKAAEIFSRMMKPVSQAVQGEMRLYQSYHSETGKPMGASNSILSLVPVGLFLKILGVKIINPFKLEVSGPNPFPWPVTVKYQGLTVVKQEKKTMIIFPNGDSTTINNDQPRVISCE